MEKMIINYEEMSWQKAEGYPEGTELKVLREGSEGAARTVILKMAKGFEMKAHSHVPTEQHIVLEGAYESGDQVFKSGTYQFIPKHTDHGPYKSAEGAVVLVIWDPV